MSVTFLHTFCNTSGIDDGFKNMRKECRFHVLTKGATDSLKLKLYYANKLNSPFWLFDEYEDIFKGPS